MNLHTWLRYTASRLGVTMQALGEMRLVDVVEQLATQPASERIPHHDLDEGFEDQELALLRSVEKAAIAVVEDDAIPSLATTCQLETEVDRIRRARGDYRKELRDIVEECRRPASVTDIGDFRSRFNASKRSR